MDGLNAILSVIASILAVIAGVLPLIAYRKEREKLKDDDTSRTPTNHAKQDEQ